MTSLDGSRRSHFGRLFRTISVGVTIGFSDMEFCMSIDGSTVSLREHVGKTEKQLWYDNEGVLFTHCDGKNPAPQPPLWAPGVSHRVPQGDPLSRSGGRLYLILRCQIRWDSQELCVLPFRIGSKKTEVAASSNWHQYPSEQGFRGSERVDDSRSF